MNNDTPNQHASAILETILDNHEAQSPPSTSPPIAIPSAAPSAPQHPVAPSLDPSKWVEAAYHAPARRRPYTETVGGTIVTHS